MFLSAKHNLITIITKLQKIMKRKKLFWMMLLCATSMILLSSCSGGSESIEYWKVYLGEKYGAISKEDYIQKRFDAMASNPNEYEMAYCFLAKKNSPYDVYKRTDNDILESVQRDIERRNNINYTSYTELMSEKIMVNMKSHPELYVENVCKIIGPVEDMRKEIASHVQVKKVEKESEADYNRYNVLYSIDEKVYVICCITEKGNGESELQEVSHSRSINEILDQWQYIIYG